MAKNQGLIGLYSGRKINELAKKKGKITRTQTALNAQKQIIKKYGQVIESAKYLHKGKGEWVKYSLANDRKRTGKTTTDIKKWRRQPNKLDYKGIDTRGSKGKSEVVKKKVVPKKKTSLTFSLSQLKAPSKPKGRTTKNATSTNKPSLKATQKPKSKVSFKVSDIKTKSKLSSRRGKSLSEKGINVDTGKDVGYRQHANIKGHTIYVTCYEGNSKLYSYTLKLSEWEDVFKRKEDPYYWMNSLLESKTPDKFKDVYNSVYYYQINAVIKAYKIY